MPFFSVIIPTYNRADLLPRCIDSILEQSFSDFEIIVVDNYSEDETKSLLEKYQQNDSRIFFIQEHNHGIIAHSRNVGIRASKGKYVCLLDSDDWFAADKLATLYEHLANDQIDILYHRMQEVDKNGFGGSYGKQLEWKNKYAELLIKGNLIYNSSVCVKRSVLLSVGGISEDINLKTAEDADCWLRIAKSGYRFGFINKVLGYYWVGDNNSGSINTLQQREYLYSIHINNLDESSRKKALHTLNYIRGIRYYEAGLKRQAKKCYLESIPMYSVEKTAKALFMVLKSLL